MKKYNIDIMPSAKEDLKQSYNWGCQNWGITKAKKWLKEARQAIYSLESFPERHPLAPESSEFNIEIRQLIFHRYRILFIVSDDTVNVLHFRGAYYQKIDQEQDDL